MADVWLWALAGLKLGSQPLVEYMRDRLHRETERWFGAWRMATGYNASGEVQYRHLSDPALSREYRHDVLGFLTDIESGRKPAATVMMAREG